MNYTIEKDGLKAVVSSLGSELQSLQSGGLEYIWQADPAIWATHAPLLFPIVGRLKDGKYDYHGKEYEMGGHGFAKKMEFTLESHTPVEVVFKLDSNDETRANYPFEFSFLVSHKIENGVLAVTYVVKNKTNGDMYFSVGAHEGYNCPLTKDEQFDDYQIVFSEKETIGREEVLPPLLGTRSLPLLNNDNILPLKHEDYKVDAIVLIGQKSDSVRLVGKKSGKGVEVTFAGWPMLGIWTKPGAPYICIEPWYGVCERTNSTGKFEQKEGIQHLQAGQTFECVHTIRCF